MFCVSADPEGIANAQKSLGLGQEEKVRKVRWVSIKVYYIPPQRNMRLWNSRFLSVSVIHFPFTLLIFSKGTEPLIPEYLREFVTLLLLFNSLVNLFQDNCGEMEMAMLIEPKKINTQQAF